MKDLLLLVLVILFGAAVLRLARRILTHTQPQPESQATPWITLTAREAKKHLDEDAGIILLDVRTQEEYDGGHKAGVHKTVDSHSSLHCCGCSCIPFCYVITWNQTDLLIGI